MIILKIFTIVIQLLCLPVKILIDFIYGINSSSNIIAYSWYTPKEYKTLLQVAEEEFDNQLFPNHKAWLTSAKKTIKEFNSRGMVVVCLDIKINDLEKWLYINNLKNNQVNREQYLYRLFYQELDNGLRVSGKLLKAGSNRATAET
ncbi:MAG: hypothetical protein L3J71_06650 [Victivallaceae bacterium]|nr:hypothetical protein [Victivallaceae bacterium]